MILNKLNLFVGNCDQLHNESSNEQEPIGLHGLVVSMKTSSIEISPSKLVPTTPSKTT